jgi:hypothetical protein
MKQRAVEPGPWDDRIQEMAEGFGNRKWHVAACYLIVSNKILEMGIWVEVDPRAGKIIQNGTADRKGK